MFKIIQIFTFDTSLKDKNIQLHTTPLNIVLFIYLFIYIYLYV